MLGPILERALAAGEGVSASRARQLRWVVGELAAFTEATEPRTRPRSPRGLLGAEHVTGYLLAADSGALRRRGEADRPSPDATRRVRRTCLRLLAEAAGLPDPVGEQVPLPVQKERAEALPAHLALRHWTGRALPVDASPAAVRSAAMATLIHEAGMRSGELAALVPADLDLVEGTVTYQPRPPAGKTLPPLRTVHLSSAAVTVLKHWLSVRAELTELTPRVKTLWVSLAANHDGFGVRRPAGMPLQPTGLRRAHARAVTQVNVMLAGTPGFAPLPRVPGRLRPVELDDAGE